MKQQLLVQKLSINRQIQQQQQQQQQQTLGEVETAQLAEKLLSFRPKPPSPLVNEMTHESSQMKHSVNTVEDEEHNKEETSFESLNTEEDDSEESYVLEEEEVVVDVAVEQDETMHREASKRKKRRSSYGSNSSAGSNSNNGTQQEICVICKSICTKRSYQSHYHLDDYKAVFPHYDGTLGKVCPACYSKRYWHRVAKPKNQEKKKERRNSAAAAGSTSKTRRSSRKRDSLYLSSSDSYYGNEEAMPFEHNSAKVAKLDNQESVTADVSATLAVNEIGTLRAALEEKELFIIMLKRELDTTRRQLADVLSQKSSSFDFAPQSFGNQQIPIACSSTPQQQLYQNSTCAGHQQYLTMNHHSMQQLPAFHNLYK
jgi:hypothetical protein